MPPPNPPYTTSAQVALLVQAYGKRSGDFDDESVPSKTAVTSMAALVSAQMDMQFQKAGYVLPLAAIAGEDWPEHQSHWLTLTASFGTAALATSHALKPAPAQGPAGQGSRGNVYQELFDKEIAAIWDDKLRVTSIRLRAQFRLGTPVEKLLTEPVGPTTDFMQGRHDPSLYMTNTELVNRMLLIEDAVRDLRIPWDHLYGLSDINLGLGAVVGE